MNELFLNLILLLPPLVACVWAQTEMRGEGSRERKRLIFLFLVPMLTYFVIQNLMLHEGHYPFWGAKQLHDLCATLLVPVAYTFVRMSIGVTSGPKVIYGLLTLIVLMLPDVCMLLKTPFDAPLPIVGAQHNYVHFEFWPGVQVRQSMYAFVIAMQVCVVIMRLLELRRVFIVRDLYLSASSRLIVRCCLAGGAWIVVSVLPSQEWLDETNLMWVINAGYSVLVTLILALVTKYYNNPVIVNCENEPVNIEDDPDSELAERMRVAIERDKVYLNCQLHIEDVAKLLGTNRTYVSRVCRVKFGMTFTELMNYHRVEYSKGLLLDDPHLRVEEVAAESGFSSASFFARVFKNREGCTPTAWRQNKH